MVVEFKRGRRSKVFSSSRRCAYVHTCSRKDAAADDSIVIALSSERVAAGL